MSEPILDANTDAVIGYRAKLHDLLIERDALRAENAVLREALARARDCIEEASRAFRALHRPLLVDAMIQALEDIQRSAASTPLSAKALAVIATARHRKAVAYQGAGDKRRSEEIIRDQRDALQAEDDAVDALDEAQR